MKLTKTLGSCEMCSHIRIAARNTDQYGKDYREISHDCIPCPRCGGRRWSAWFNLDGSRGYECRACYRKKVMKRATREGRKRMGEMNQILRAAGGLI